MQREFASRINVARGKIPQTVSATKNGDTVGLDGYNAALALVQISGGVTCTSSNKWTLTFEDGAVADTLTAVDDAFLSGSLVAPVGDKATSTITVTSNATNGKIFVIGERTYKFVTALSTGPAVANEIKIGDTLADTKANIIAAINGAAGAGTTYGTGTVANTQVVASAGGTGAVIITAILAGVAGNAIATTTDDSACAWTSTVMAGGVDPLTVDIGATGAYVINAAIPSCGLLGEISYTGSGRYLRPVLTKAASAPNVIVSIPIIRGDAANRPA